MTPELPPIATVQDRAWRERIDEALPIAGYHEIPHRDPLCVRRVFWIDREDVA